MKDKKCLCGLRFMPVDWLHNRKRGYCSVKCRKDFILAKLEIRNNLRSNEKE